MIVLNQKNKVLSRPRIYEGSLHTTVVRVGDLFRDAVRPRRASHGCLCAEI